MPFEIAHTQKNFIFQNNIHTLYQWRNKKPTTTTTTNL